MSFGSDGVPSLKRRTLALAIDLLLGTLMVLLMNPLLALVPSSAPSLVLLVSTAALMVIWPVYLIVSQAMTGSTLGKWLLGMQLIRRDGTNGLWPAVLVRYSVPILCQAALVLVWLSVLGSVDMDAFRASTPLGRMTPLRMATPPPIMTAYSWIAASWWIVGLLVARNSQGNRALHDHMAGTIVLWLPRSQKPMSGQPPQV